MLNIQILPNFKVSSQLHAPRNFVQPSLRLRHCLTRYSEPCGVWRCGFEAQGLAMTYYDRGCLLFQGWVTQL